jgi:hypothetical protein
MLTFFFLLVASRGKEKQGMVTQKEPCKRESYELQYSNQVIKFFDAADLEWVQKETPRRHPWAIEQRKKAFRFFNQTKLKAFKSKPLEPGPVIYN